MAKKRGNGEGSVSQRPNGTWQGQVSLGRDENGKMKRATYYGKTRREVAEKIKLALGEQQKGNLVPPVSDTLKSYILLWLEKKKLSVSIGTWHKYETNARINIIPTLGKEKIQKITKPLIQKFINERSNKLAPATVKILQMILHQVFDSAIDDGLIYRNPATKIELPKIEQREFTVLTEEQMTAILQQCHGTRLYPVVFVEYGTGLRRSEILALEWDSVDFINNTIMIKQSYVLVNGIPVLQKTTKTEASKATIAVPKEITDYITTLPRTGNFIFSQRNGKPLHPNAFYRDFKLKLEKVGLKELHFHDLRHNYASKLVALNVHQRLIQAQLRHTDARTTNRYSHVTIAGQQEAAATLGTILPQLQ